MDNYWRWMIRNDSDREWVVAKVDQVRKGASWTEEEYGEACERRARTGRWEEEVDGLLGERAEREEEEEKKEMDEKEEKREERGEEKD
ncbi:hypothetical protein P7C70_g5460, partial [Phenoliferia sp. Uapishka_3]